VRDFSLDIYLPIVLFFYAFFFDQKINPLRALILSNHSCLFLAENHQLSFTLYPKPITANTRFQLSLE